MSAMPRTPFSWLGFFICFSGLIALAAWLLLGVYLGLSSLAHYHLWIQRR